MKKNSNYITELSSEFSNNYPVKSKTGNSSKVIVVTYKNSWGEVDVSLPILFAVKNQNKYITIVTVIESPAMISAHFIMEVLFNKLREVSDVFIYPAVKEHEGDAPALSKSENELKTAQSITTFKKALRKFIRTRLQSLSFIWKVYLAMQNLFIGTKWSFLFDAINPDDVKLLIEDHTASSKLQLLLRKKCTHAKIVLYPHATSLYIKEHGENTPKIMKHADMFFLSSDLAVEWARYKFPNVKNFHVTGFSRYDKWWVETVSQDTTYINSTEFQNKDRYEKVFTFFTHDVNPLFLPFDLFKYLVESTCDVVFSYDNSFLMIKPHPRQDLKTLISIMQKYPAQKWKISSLQAMQISMISDVVISMWSSTILDALAVQKPVIEFFDHSNNPRAITGSDGGKYSEYGLKKLSLPVQTKEELQRLIEGYFTYPQGSLWKNQKEMAQKIMKLDNKSCIRASQLIYDIIN